MEKLFWDPNCRGFGLRTLASGRRTWIFQYRDAHGKTRRLALGDASAVALDAARTAARRHAAAVTQGANPSAERKVRQRAKTVLALVDAYLADATTREAPLLVETKRHLRKHAAPLHYEKVEAIHRSDISALLSRVSKSSGPSAANRLRAALSAMWSWGIRAGMIDADVNVVAFTLRHKEQSRTTTLSDASLRAIWAATGRDHDYDRIVRLCLVTGCRRDEIGGLRWDEILADRLSIGADRMKGNAPHEVPLLPALSKHFRRSRRVRQGTYSAAMARVIPAGVRAKSNLTHALPRPVRR